MENRIAPKSSGRPGAALTALAGIVVITAGWWALALWPVGSVAPEWLVRTRSACFGATRGGLPDAAGWILLIGEPIGMLALLGALWGHSLRQNLRWIWSQRVWRLAGMSLVIASIGFFATLGLRVARAEAWSPAEIPVARGRIQKVGRPAPPFVLVNQRGDEVTLGGFRNETVLITFAYGHCSTVCPAIVSDMRFARMQSGREDVRIVVMTLDPWRDTPERLPTLAKHWLLESRDHVLSGSVETVEKTLDALGIGRRRNETTGDIDHGTTVMLIDERGRIAWRMDGGGDLRQMLDGKH